MDVVFAREQRPPVTAIGRYGRGDNWGVLGSQGEALGVAGPKGKTIGIHNDAWTTAQPAMMPAYARFGMSDVKTVDAADDTLPLPLPERVDAVAGITNAERTGMRVTGEQTPSFLPTVARGVSNTPIFTLAANSDWPKRNPDLGKAFLRATAKSVDYALDGKPVVRPYQPDERVSVRDLVDCTKAIALAVHKWCA